MSRKKTTEEFVEEAKLVHGNRYDYSKTEYINAITKLIVVCRQHGDFLTLPNKHLSRNCRICSNTTRSRSVSKSILIGRFKAIKQPEDYKIIPLSNGKHILVDNDDFNRVKNIVWYQSVSGEGYSYGYNLKYGFIHRFIMKPPRHLVVDHINGDTLDNRRSNLRICSSQENRMNSKRMCNNKSGAKGVYVTNDGRYSASIYKNGVRHSIGRFKTLKEASNAYDDMAIKLHGEFAKLNNLNK